jgi:hypothetical protein
MILKTDEQEVKQFIISKYNKTLSLKENNTLSKDIKSFCFSNLLTVGFPDEGYSKIN